MELHHLQLMHLPCLQVGQLGILLKSVAIFFCHHLEMPYNNKNEFMSIQYVCGEHLSCFLYRDNGVQRVSHISLPNQ